MLALLLWAGALVFTQCITWLKTNVWQSVSATAVFMSPEAQTFHLRVANVRVSPLDLAPSWAAFDSEGAVVESVSGRMAGLARIVAWLLDLGLSVWLVVASFVVGGLSGLISEGARKR